MRDKLIRCYLVKGVSPIVATVMLILISLAASLILWTWISNTISQTATSSEIYFLNERVRIEAVSAQSNLVKVYVRNLMSNDVKIGAVYIINGTSGIAIAQNLTSVTIGGGDVAEVVINLRTVLSPGVYIAKVTTVRGYEASYVFAVT